MVDFLTAAVTIQRAWTHGPGYNRIANSGHVFDVL